MYKYVSIKSHLNVCVGETILTSADKRPTTTKRQTINLVNCSNINLSIWDINLIVKVTYILLVFILYLENVKYVRDTEFVML